MITFADSQGIYVEFFHPKTINGFFWWRGDLREVRDIHRVNNGVQYELYDIDWRNKISPYYLH